MSIKSFKNGVDSKVNFKTLLQDVPKGVQLPFFSQIEIPIDKILSSQLNDLLICIDDLERKHHNLDINQVFGLASYLKEHKNCSVIFIVNSDQIEEKDQYKKYLEKTISAEISLKRTVKDCCDLIFENDRYYESILESLKILEIYNLRILQRIKVFKQHFLSLVTNSIETETINEIIKKIIILVWVKFGDTNYSPSIQLLRKFSRLPFSGRLINDSNVSEEEENKWRPILNDYKFSNFNEYDELIWLYIDKGIIDVNAFKLAIEKRNQYYLNQSKRISFYKAWDIYNNSFNDNVEEFTEKLTNSAIELIEVDSISIGEINSTYSVLVELKKDNLAQSVIDKYISIIKEYNENYFFDQTINSGRDLHENVKNLIIIHAKENETKNTFESVLDGVAFKMGWGGDVIDFLQSKTEDEFYEFLSQANTELLKRHIDFCLRLGKSNNPSKEHLMISEKMKNALVRIGKTNELNRMRVERIYNLRIDEL